MPSVRSSKEQARDREVQIRYPPLPLGRTIPNQNSTQASSPAPDLDLSISADIYAYTTTNRQNVCSCWEPEKKGGRGAKCADGTTPLPHAKRRKMWDTSVSYEDLLKSLSHSPAIIVSCSLRNIRLAPTCFAPFSTKTKLRESALVPFARMSHCFVTA